LTQPRRSWIQRPWVPVLAGVLAFVITLFAGSIVAADWFWRSVEMDALLDRVEASETVMGQLQDDAAQAFEDHGGGADPVKLESTLKALAADARVEIAEAGSSVAELPIAVWHTDIEAARDAYLAHNRAWQDYMQRASNSAEEFVLPQDSVNTTFFDAQAPFVGAVPLPDVSNLLDRVAVIFEIPDDLDSGGMDA
jgi:hypothetical protein